MAVHDRLESILMRDHHFKPRTIHSMEDMHACFAISAGEEVGSTGSWLMMAAFHDVSTSLPMPVRVGMSLVLMEGHADAEVVHVTAGGGHAPAAHEEAMMLAMKREGRCTTQATIPVTTERTGAV